MYDCRVLLLFQLLVFFVVAAAVAASMKHRCCSCWWGWVAVLFAESALSLTARSPHSPRPKTVNNNPELRVYRA